jgi:Single-strand binding protein family
LAVEPTHHPTGRSLHGQPPHPSDGELTADEAFARLNPTLGTPQDPLDPTRRSDVRDQEDVAARGYRVAHADWTENDLPGHQAIQHLRDRARGAQPDPEQAFDRLNPTFGVPADRTDRIGHRDVAQREAALTLGVRVAVHDSRQNDPNPVMWQSGRTTAWPTPSTPPAPSPPALVGGQNASAPNANYRQHEQGVTVMAADNHTTIIGNLVEDPEVRFTNNNIAVTNLRVAVTQRVQQDGQWRDGDTSSFR